TKFAVFNFADCCVTIGAVLLILSTLLSFRKDTKSSRD
ncbi:MAG: signal peptidase II, partial [Clostridia bacterium]|nr:signal peptidase II [Clostridia bacterium]